VVTLAALVCSIILSVGSMAWGYAEAGFLSVSRYTVFFGIAWLIALWRRWNWFSSLGLFAAVFAAAVGFWIELDIGWMIAGAAFALFAWDLAEFRRRIQFLIVDDEMRGIARRHIARVSLVILGGLLLVTLALSLQLKLTFEWSVFLVLVILLGLTQLAAWFGKQ
jgi:hypothetical protein